MTKTMLRGPSITVVCIVIVQLLNNIVQFGKIIIVRVFAISIKGNRIR